MLEGTARRSQHWLGVVAAIGIAAATGLMVGAIGGVVPLAIASALAVGLIQQTLP